MPHRSARAARSLITAQREPRKIEWASDMQRLVFNHGPSPICMSGGFNAAKTFVGCLKALYLSDLYPGNRGVIVRSVGDQLRKTTLPTFFSICPPEAYALGRRNDQEKIVVLNNGSQILWLHLDDSESEKIIRGLEINWFLIDQAEEIKEDAFDLLTTRLGRWRCDVPEWILQRYERRMKRPWPWMDRLMKPIVPTYPMLTCNPDTELHWIWRRFHPDSPDREVPRVVNPYTGELQSYRDLGYQLFTMTSVENRFISRQNLTTLLSKDPTYVRRFVLGEWGMPEGRIHEVSALSLVPATRDFIEYLKRNCTLHRTLDHGEFSPTCCMWWAVDREGNCFAYREYYMPNKLISTHRANLAAMSDGENYGFNIADPSIFNPSSQKNGRRWSVSDEYSDPNIPNGAPPIHWQPGDNNEMGTRNRISEYLEVDPKRINPVTKKLGSPRLFFLTRTAECPDACDHVVRELRAARRLRIGSENGRPIFCDDRDEKQEDHAYDNLRYFIASRPPLPNKHQQAMSQGTFEAVRNRLLEFNRRNGYGKLVLDARRKRVI